VFSGLIISLLLPGIHFLGNGLFVEGEPVDAFLDWRLRSLMDNELKVGSGIEFIGYFDLLSGFELMQMLCGVFGIFYFDSDVFKDVCLSTG